MKISIVIAYYNRLNLLDFTLKTIKNSNYKNFEVVIVDDASDPNQNPELIIKKYNFDIKLITIKKEDKKHMNSCIPYNIGFKETTGDIIIIQNPECCHIGDIMLFIANNLKENQYFSFSCFNFPQSNYNHDLHQIYQNNENYQNVLQLLNNITQSYGNNIQTWYNHKIYRPEAFHFLSAIYKKDLDRLGGFDERYAYGSGYDDGELIERIKHINMDVIYIDIEKNNPFTIHQWHPKITSINNAINADKNRIIFNQHMKELGINKYHSHV